MDDKHLIYAVDDEESIRELYFYALQSAGFEIKCFACAEELYLALNNANPDLILLDIMLEGQDGFTILQTLKENNKYSQIPVIMVSAKGEEINKVKGLNAGADDYISKPFGVMELSARINANLRRYSKNRNFVYKDVSINNDLHEIKLKGDTLTLTLKEYNLLKLLVENAQKTISREEIFNAVWGENYFGETRTLDIHITELRKKLQTSEIEIVTVRGVGYMIK